MATTADPVEQLAARLERLEQKLDALTEGLAALTSLSARAGLLAEAAGDTAAFAWREAEKAGVDPIERGQAGLELALRLSEPGTMALVGKLVDRTDALEAAVGALDGVSGADLARAMKATTALLANPDFQRLLDAAPAALAVAGPATTALTETKRSGWEPKGPIGALMAISDPEVQRAVGFSLAVAKRLGKAL